MAAPHLPYKMLAGVVPCPGGWLMVPARLAGVTVVAEDPMVIGYCVGVKVADEAELANLAVDPSRRGTGVGAALLRAFLDQVDAEPPRPAVYLEVRASNAAAQRLYARAGFVPAGVRRDYYERPREDALVLRRPPGPVGG